MNIVYTSDLSVTSAGFMIFPFPPIYFYLIGRNKISLLIIRLRARPQVKIVDEMTIVKRGGFPAQITFGVYMNSVIKGTESADAHAH